MAEPQWSQPRRRRARRGSLERPISGRAYRAAWVAVLVPLLAAAFSVATPEPLPGPQLPPSFDQATAVQFAAELARNDPDRSPGTTGARQATDWVAQRFADLGLRATRHAFTAEVAGLGTLRLVNVFAIVPGDSRQAIVVMAHRDNLGVSPGANDNASGTGALLELARNVVIPTDGEPSPLAHTLVFVSTDGDAYGGLGAAELARHPETVTGAIGPDARVIAVVNLDGIAGAGPPRLEFAGDTPRSPAASLLATARSSIVAQARVPPSRPGPVGQLIDLAFPFSLFGQAPLIAHGLPAVTITSGDGRPPSPRGDTVGELRRGQLGALGRAAQALLGSLDEAAEPAGGTQSYLYLGNRLVHGWAIQLTLLGALLPFLAATVDLFARCRRRHIRLAGALASFRSRLGLWLWAGGLFALFAVTGILPGGDARPIAPDTPAAGDWPVAALAALAGLSALAWLVVRPRLAPTRPAERTEELGGHLAAMLALAIVALVVAATNPYALVFVLPSLHTWLWLPQLDGFSARLKLGLFGLGFAGPLLLLASFAIRFDLGLDAPWYVVALTSVGYVPVPLVIAFLGWGAVAMQVGAIAAGRYAPYPSASERPPRGPIRETIRQLVLLSRRAKARRRERQEPVVDAEAEPERVDYAPRGR